MRASEFTQKRTLDQNSNNAENINSQASLQPPVFNPTLGPVQMKEESSEETKAKTESLNSFSAAAYTSGASNIFAEKPPSRDFVAHEMSHAVQRGNDAKTKKEE